MEKVGVETIIYTDISRDGTLTGPNLEQMANLKEHVKVNLIASGGVSSRADLEALANSAYTEQLPEKPFIIIIFLCQIL